MKKIFVTKISKKMSFKGEWSSSNEYQKSDMVFVSVYEYLRGVRTSLSGVDYFICTMDHQSGGFINPSNHEEVYWCKVNDEFLSYYSCLSQITPSLNLEIQTTLTQGLETLPKPCSSPSPSEPEVVLISPEEILFKKKRKNIERKIEHIENDIENYRKKKKVNNSLDLTLGERLVLLNVDLDTKTFLIDKYANIKKSTGSDYSKGIAWIKTALSLPYKKYKPLPIKVGDPKEEIIEFFDNIKAKLDERIHGLEYVKEEIMEYLARKITSPRGKGHVLGLCGAAGVGKTAIISAIGEALELPFHQINMGGLNDVSVLTGHSETYVGAKPGKIVEILSKAGCMNVIIYLDEIDKFSEHKGTELNGILTHLLDEEQNDKFQDNYLSNVNIDLSKVFFVVAFNDISKIDPIVLNRIKIINIKNPSVDDKVTIARDKILPKLLEGQTVNLEINDDLLLYIIKEKVPEENGVRQLKKCLEKVINKLNYLLLTGKIKDIKKEFTKQFIDDALQQVSSEDTSYKMMYM